MTERPTRSRPNELRQWYAVVTSQVSHYLRSYRFLGLLGFIVLISAVTILLELQSGVTLVRAVQLYSYSEYLSNFYQWGNLWIFMGAAFFAGDALSVDFSTGTGYYMLVLPIHRRTLIAGRYVSATLAILAILVIFFVIGILGGAYFFGIGDVPWLKVGITFGLYVVLTLAAVSVAFCISAVVRSPSAGVLTTILTLYVGFMTLETTVELTGQEPWFSLNYAGNGIPNVLDIDFSHVAELPVGTGQYTTLWTAYPSEGAVIISAYVVVFFLLSLFLYNRKESTG